MPNTDKILTVEDAEILFRNFSGHARPPYNEEGDRNFCLILDEDDAARLERDGWNVKELVSRDEDEPDRKYIQVSVSYKIRPPRVVLLTESGTRTPLSEGEVGMLDWADIRMVDLTVRPYEWEVRGERGIKAYLKTMFVTIYQDPIEQKYESPGTPVGEE